MNVEIYKECVAKALRQNDWKDLYAWNTDWETFEFWDYEAVAMREHKVDSYAMPYEVFAFILSTLSHNLKATKTWGILKTLYSNFEEIPDEYLPELIGFLTLCGSHWGDERSKDLAVLLLEKAEERASL